MRFLVTSPLKNGKLKFFYDMANKDDDDIFTYGCLILIHVIKEIWEKLQYLQHTDYKQGSWEMKIIPEIK